MERHNYYFEQLVGVPDMIAVETVPQNGIRDILVSLGNKGIISGFGTIPTTPVNSMSVLVQPGKIALEDGTIVSTTLSTALDLSQTGTVSTGGKSRWVTVYACPKQTSDTPLTTPAGDVINYRTYDDVQYVFVVGDEDYAPVYPVAAPAGFVGSLLCDIKREFGQTAITADQIKFERTQFFQSIPAILTLINDALLAAKLLETTVHVNGSTGMTMDVSQGRTFHILLTADVATFGFSNLKEGMEITLIFQQDNLGNRGVSNPGTVHGFGLVAPDANSKSQQKFKVHDNLELYPLTAMTAL